MAIREVTYLNTKSMKHDVESSLGKRRRRLYHQYEDAHDLDLDLQEHTANAMVVIPKRLNRLFGSWIFDL